MCQSLTFSSFGSRAFCICTKYMEFLTFSHSAVSALSSFRRHLKTHYFWSALLRYSAHWFSTEILELYKSLSCLLKKPLTHSLICLCLWLHIHSTERLWWSSHLSPSISTFCQQLKTSIFNSPLMTSLF